MPKKGQKRRFTLYGKLRKEYDAAVSSGKFCSCNACQECAEVKPFHEMMKECEEENRTRFQFYWPR